MDHKQPLPPPNTPKIEKLIGQIAKDPRSKDFIPLAEEYEKAGMLQEAALTLEDGLKIFPSFVTALVRLGGVYLQLDERTKAQNRLEEAITHSPDNILAHRMLAKLHVLNHNYEWARQSCEKVLHENPHDKEMLKLKLEIEEAGSLSSEMMPSQDSSMSSSPESTHISQDACASPSPTPPTDTPISEEATTGSFPLSEPEQDDTPDHHQQYVRKLSQLLERIQERRIA